jgi:hypothetical protein
MKCQADKKRFERQFTIGDSVFLKLQPYIQTSVAPRANQKLAFKFFGPFKIIDKIGVVAYKLQLPESATIHPVFHVSQLKKVVPPSHQVTQDIPTFSDKQVPVAVLQRHLAADGNIKEALIQWSDMPSTLATWENREDLHRRFPHAPGSSRICSRGGVAATLTAHQMNTLAKMGLAGETGCVDPTRRSPEENGPSEEDH